MKTLLPMPSGWVEVTLPPREVRVALSVFDAKGTLLREEEYPWYDASQLASCLTEVGMPADDAERVAKELIDAHEQEEASLPPPGWLPEGCLSGFSFAALALIGLGFLIWFGATRLF